MIISKSVATNFRRRTKKCQVNCSTYVEAPSGGPDKSDPGCLDLKALCLGL